MTEVSVPSDHGPAALDYPELYDWQHEALDTWRGARRRGIVQAVTGSGKTRLGLAATVDALKKGFKVLVLVPGAELQGQWRRSILAAMPGVRLGLLGNDHSESFSDVDVLVAIVNSAAKHSLLLARRAGLIIADECHRYAARTFAEALQDNFGWRLGLTATLKRGDRGDQTVLLPYFGDPVYTYGHEQARRDRIIAPFDVAMVGIDLDMRERTEYDEFSEKAAKVLPYLEREIGRNPALRRREFNDAVAHMAGDAGYGPLSMMARGYLYAIRRRTRIAAEAGRKMTLLPALGEVFATGAKSLVFGESVDVARRAAAILAAQGVRSASVHSQLGPEERRSALQGFRIGTTSVLTAPRVLDEGIDVPDAELAVVLSGSRTERQMIQRLGRVIRRKPSGGMGRLVYLYARDTVEDPGTQTDFLPNILPFARSVKTFDLENESADLVQFLLRPADPEPVDEHTSDEPVVGESWESPDSWILWDSSDDDGPAEHLYKTRPVTEDAFADYLRAIGETDLLTAEEEVDLAQQIEAGVYARHLLEGGEDRPRKVTRALTTISRLGDAAMDHMVRANTRLVVSIAKKHMWGHRLDVDDVVQLGNEGLIRAVQKFDYTHGTKFSTYATWWIRQAISRGIHDSARTVRLPVHVEEEVRKVQKAASELGGSVHELDIDRISRKSGLPTDKVSSIRRWTQPIRSLDKLTLVDGRYEPYGALLVDAEALTDFDIASFGIFQEQLHAVLDTLTEREAGVIAMRFGLTDGICKTLDEIGQVYGVTRERIRQIEKKTLEILREPEYAAVLEPYLD
ncbi:sigma-70 family RNA polymerase sigma factor [Cellulosimicrobium funkei]|nr:sigma-70 family RNA polymerase sigma factor [Cellulosimicrobium funkei]